MVRLQDVTEEERNLLLSRGGRGHAAYPIVQAFIESKKDMVRIDPEDPSVNIDNLVANLRNHIDAKRLPIKCITRRGAAYLVKIADDEAPVTLSVGSVKDE